MTCDVGSEGNCDDFVDMCEFPRNGSEKDASLEDIGTYHQLH